MQQMEVIKVYLVPTAVVGDSVSNHKCLIYDSKSVEILRNQYRILAIPFGSLPNYTQQNDFSSLPCLITPESVTLGIEYGFIRVFEDLHSSNITRLQDLMLNPAAKSNSTTAPSGHNSGISQVFFKFQIGYEPSNQTSLRIYEEPKDITRLWTFPQTPFQQEKYKVFKDLHNSGFFLSSGDKFGCDFLAYRGDPVLHHAEFMIYVQEIDKPIEPHLIISIGRLGNTVHKTVLFASWNSSTQSVQYVSLNWFNPQPIKPWKIKELCDKESEENEEEDEVQTLGTTMNSSNPIGKAIFNNSSHSSSSSSTNKIIREQIPNSIGMNGQQNTNEDDDVIEQEDADDDESEKDNICLICQDEWKEEGEHKVVALACGHLFGQSCISQWLATKPNCPMCKKPARPNELRPIFLGESSANRLAIHKVKKMSEKEKQDIRSKLRVERKKRRVFEKRLLELRKKITNYLNSIENHQLLDSQHENNELVHDDHDIIEITSESTPSSVIPFLRELQTDIEECPFEIKLFDTNNEFAKKRKRDVFDNEQDVIVTTPADPSLRQNNIFTSVLELNIHSQHKIFRFLDDPSYLCFDSRKKHSLVVYSTVKYTTTEISLDKNQQVVEAFDINDMYFSRKNNLIYCATDNKFVKVVDVKSRNGIIFDMEMEDVPNCLAIPDDTHDSLLLAGLENGAICGMDLRMPGRVVFRFDVPNTPRTSHANSILSMQYVPSNDSLIFATLGSGVFHAKLNVQNNYHSNSESEGTKLAWFQDQLTTLKANNRTNVPHPFNICYDSFSHKAIISYSTFGESKRNIDHCIMNEENGRFNPSNIVISEPTVMLPPSHQFTIFERVEHHPTPIGKFKSPTALFNLTNSGAIDLESNNHSSPFAFFNGTTLMAYTALKNKTFFQSRV
ncbi:hypothetical protein C9374_001671 [Naegleria lovaniensis]|uniref:tRNA-intron lyase n=1 Tax=Naegleria lovaniensis TaxID=51637 RepID=A0AA88KMV9_NAELO|nr:uncharacterized protein C9374_001671 [Naegleria lovaniensis]KAG2387339.1 hypothetical protein C9374_001671 [Naegleria lovaniensis]